MVRLAGIEPTTPWFVAKYSIQLSYSRTAAIVASGFFGASPGRSTAATDLRMGRTFPQPTQLREHFAWTDAIFSKAALWLQPAH